MGNAGRLSNADTASLAARRYGLNFLLRVPRARVAARSASLSPVRGLVGTVLECFRSQADMGKSSRERELQGHRGDAERPGQSAAGTLGRAFRIGGQGNGDGVRVDIQAEVAHNFHVPAFQTLGETCTKTNWQVHALCLMPNHFHLVVETPRANLVAGMKWFLGTYTARFNRRHKLFGHLFSGRYKSLVVDGSGNGYLRTVCDYVHLNPVRAKLLAAEEPLRGYGWSSYGEYLKVPGRRWEWLRVDRLLGEAGIAQDSRAGRREFEQQMERRRAQEMNPADWRSVRRGWCLGDAPFKKELLAQMQESFGAHHGGEEREESCEARAEGLLESELKRLGWTKKQLAQRRKSDAGKVRVARRLREETTMTLAWIAQRLAMGSASTVAQSLRRNY